MQDIKLDYGDSYNQIELPDTATVVRYGITYNDPPTVDPVATTRTALDNPLGFPPLWELSGPNKKIVIAFPDRVKGGNNENSHRRISIPMILKDLIKGGADLNNITLLCAIGLHRKNTLEEWYWYLGNEIVDNFLPDRIVNYDAEDKDLCDYGIDSMGNRVQCNRLIAEADLPITVGHCAGNPYGGFSGGYKMIVTGFSGWESIASHHGPKTMHRKDWMGPSTDTHMRHQFKSIGKAMEEGIGKRFFSVDAVLGQKSQILDVKAGLIEEVEKETWPLAKKRTNILLKETDKADILVIGLPRNFHYGPGMGSNPILMSLAIGGQLSRCWHAFREGGVIIAAAICDGWFNELWFPSYLKTYDALQKYCNANDFLNSDDSKSIVNDYEYRFQYSTNYTYHPFHAMSMVSGGSTSLLWTSAIYVAGAKAPEYARGMGFIPTNNFKDALKLSKKYVGNNPKILCTPECFSGGVGVHLQLE
jgi:nickel-dependent lactate racemase